MKFNPCLELMPKILVYKWHCYETLLYLYVEDITYHYSMLHFFQVKLSILGNVWQILDSAVAFVLYISCQLFTSIPILYTKYFEQYKTSIFLQDYSKYNWSADGLALSIQTIKSQTRLTRRVSMFIIFSSAISYKNDIRYQKAIKDNNFVYCLFITLKSFVTPRC